MKALQGPARSIDPRFTCYRLRIRRSPVHGYGVFAVQNIPRGRKVIEYTGERINFREAWARHAKARGEGGTRRVYLFKIKRNHFVDAENGGSGAERVNHGCDPNLTVRRIRGHLLFFSRRRIRAGEELTLDYRFRPNPIDPIACHCGSSKCRGTINLPKAKH